MITKPSASSAYTLPTPSPRERICSAYYAADYCAYPVASFEADAVKNIESEIKGLRG